MKDDSLPCTPEAVLLYYPNIIGYIRLLCMLLSFYFFFSSPALCIFLYLAAFAGDVIDGYVARAFDQSSGYGAILDMVTDRISTAGFLLLLSHLYRPYAFTFAILLALDISSHWFHVLRFQLTIASFNT